MTTELILLLAIYAFILLGAVFGDPSGGIFNTFSDSGPKFAAKLERNLATGTKFNKSSQTWVQK